MGAQLQYSGGRAKTRRRKTNPITNINVTPFVDVMLVLLVVFMITAPLLTVGVPVDLPKTKANAVPTAQEVISVSIQKDGKIYIQDTEVTMDKLAPKLQAITGQNKNTKIFVRADQSIQYGGVMKLMGVISAAGFNKVALITDSAK